MFLEKISFVRACQDLEDSILNLASNTRLSCVDHNLVVADVVLVLPFISAIIIIIRNNEPMLRTGMVQ